MLLKTIFIVLALILTGCNTNPTPKEYTETSEVILSILNDPTNNDYICKRVKQFTDGNTTKEQCLKNLPTSKEICGRIINNYVGRYATTNEVTKWIVRKTIFCQVWTVLGYETIADEKGIRYKKKKGGILD